MTFEMRLDKVNRASDGKVFFILEGAEGSLRGYLRADEADSLDFQHVYEIEIKEAE